MSAPVDSPINGSRRTDYAADVASYRQDFRRYLRDLEPVDEWRSAAFTSAEDGLAHDAQVMARLHADGWNRYGWPEAAGGLGGNEIHRAVYYEELGYAMLPIPAQHWTLETLGPALLRFAPGLAAAYLPGYLSGAEWWGQSLAKVDINTHQVKYYPFPIPNANVYDVDVFQKDHTVWATLRNGERAAKFDPFQCWGAVVRFQDGEARGSAWREEEIVADSRQSY